MVNDPVGDFINSIKNAQQVGHSQVTVPHSRLKEAIAKKLEMSGFVGASEVKTRNGRQVLEVALVYRQDGTPKVIGTERVSKPGRRLYASVAELSTKLRGHGLVLVSTPKGILTDVEARKERVGGELLCKVW